MMAKLIGTAFCLLTLFLLPSRGLAAAFELIPSWKRVDAITDGVTNAIVNHRYNYRAFYIDNKKKAMYLCFASFLEKEKKLSLECGAEVNLGWKLPSSSDVKTAMVGTFDTSDDDANVPFGLWQIDEVTGDWQFCLDGNIAGKNNCVLSKTP